MIDFFKLDGNEAEESDVFTIFVIIGNKVGRFSLTIKGVNNYWAKIDTVRNTFLFRLNTLGVKICTALTQPLSSSNFNGLS